MSDKPAYANDECLTVIKELLIAITNTTLRPLHTELLARFAVMESIKKSGLIDPRLLDRLFEQALHSEDTKKSVDRKLESILKVARSLDGPNRDQVLEALLKSQSQSTVEN